MNQSIRCEPLPFPVVSEKAAGEAALCPVEGDSNFGEVLDAELGESSSNPEQENAEKMEEGDAWAVYGVAPTVIQILQQEIVTGTAVAETEGSAVPPEGEAAPDGTTSAISLEHFQPASSRQNAEIPRNEHAAQEGEAALQMLRAEILKRLEPLPPQVQKVPSPVGETSPIMAQIARKAVEPAKIADGMVAAQRPPMMLAQPNRDDKAPKPEQTLPIEHFEASSFEQPVRMAHLPREIGPKQDAETLPVAEISPVVSEWSSFEGVAETSEVQPARPVTAAVLSESIRTHVQLLGSSGQNRLEVVLRPDAHTELHLSVETVNGRIQVQARCDRGDFALLDANWNAVQSTLGMQGIRVEPLQVSNGAHFQQNSQNPSQSFGEQSSQRQEREQFFIEQEFPNRKGTRQQTTGGTSARGWQSWA